MDLAHHPGSYLSVDVDITPEYKAAGPPVQLEPVDLSVKTPVVLQVPRYNPAVIISAAARRVPSPSTTPTPPPASLYVSSTETPYWLFLRLLIRGEYLFVTYPQTCHICGYVRGIPRLERASNLTFDSRLWLNHRDPRRLPCFMG
ncbi:Krueppel-like factor 6 isoform X2 [Vespula squamosa]|uniref:Krueppel-like factor 6 isoform X2 n=1 Tax=Vespula squamosa TaxID=30214 RepID=A0ABD1ZTE9_VESSQ